MRNNKGQFIKSHEVPNEWREMVSVRQRGNTYRRGSTHTQEANEKNRQAHLGKVAWNKGLKGFRAGKQHHYFGKKRPEISGDKAPNWKGGITPINKAIRQSFEYEEWRKAVFERDLYTCQGCGIVGGYLEADHIKPFSLYPELRTDVNNGRTLCKPCHQEIGWNKFREDNPRKRIGQNI